MIGRLWRALTGPLVRRRRARLDLRYCSCCWDYTTCWKKREQRNAAILRDPRGPGRPRRPWPPTT